MFMVSVVLANDEDAGVEAGAKLGYGEECELDGGAMLKGNPCCIIWMFSIGLVAAPTGLFNLSSRLRASHRCPATILSRWPLSFLDGPGRNNAGCCTVEARSHSCEFALP